mgnify:CR=1 FL=1
MTNGRTPQVLPPYWLSMRLADLCQLNPRPLLENIPDETRVSFIPMASVEEESGKVDLSRIRLLKEVKKGYTSFADRDVIFAKITPCMENVKVAVVDGLMNGVGFG